jgi:hypothetical protein
MPLTELSAPAQTQVDVFAAKVDEAFGDGYGGKIKDLIEKLFDGLKPMVDPKVDVAWLDDLLKKLAPLIGKSGPFLKVLAALLPILLTFLAKTPDAKPKTKDKITTI